MTRLMLFTVSAVCVFSVVIESMPLWVIGAVCVGCAAVLAATRWAR